MGPHDPDGHPEGYDADRFFGLLDKLNREPVTLPVTNPVDGETVDFVLNGDRLSTWLFSAMYTNTQIPATVGRFLDGDFEELQQSPHLFFPLTRFAYGLSYSIFASSRSHHSGPTFQPGIRRCDPS